MRVLNVNHTLDPVTGGGTAERTFQMSRALVRAGEECDVLALDPGLTPAQEEALAGARLHALPWLVRRFYVPRFSPRHIYGVVAGTDVVHLMGHWTFVNALIYLYARWLGKPYVFCSAGALPIFGRSGHIKRLYNLLVGRNIVRNAAGHVAITADERPHFEAYGVPAAKVEVIPNGIDETAYDAGDDLPGFRERHGLGDVPFVLFVGRLNPVKGPDLLLQAFCAAREDLPRHHLVFVGPDEGMLAGLRGTAAACGISHRVHFVGYLGGAEKARAYAAAELLVVPSRQEAMSIVALEAGAAGTPVLLTDRCGFDEVERAGGGRVVPATAEGLRRGLVRLLGEPEALRSMGANLQNLVRERYAWGSIIRQYLDLYGRILGHG